MSSHLSQSKRDQESATRASQGRISASTNATGLSGAAENHLANGHLLPMWREVLQNADGTFKYRPKDDGTLEAGRWGIDSYGRFVAVDW